MIVVFRVQGFWLKCLVRLDYSRRREKSIGSLVGYIVPVTRFKFVRPKPQS